jgi:hypothetical protein
LDAIKGKGSDAAGLDSYDDRRAAPNSGGTRGLKHTQGAAHPRQTLGQLEGKRHRSLSTSRKTKAAKIDDLRRFAGGPADVASTAGRSPVALRPRLSTGLL